MRIGSPCTETPTWRQSGPLAAEARASSELARRAKAAGMRETATDAMAPAPANIATAMHATRVARSLPSGRRLSLAVGVSKFTRSTPVWLIASRGLANPRSLVPYPGASRPASERAAAQASAEPRALERRPLTAAAASCPTRSERRSALRCNRIRHPKLSQRAGQDPQPQRQHPEPHQSWQPPLQRSAHPSHRDSATLSPTG